MERACVAGSVRTVRSAIGYARRGRRLGGVPTGGRGGQRDGLRGPVGRAVPPRLQLVDPVWKPLLSVPESFAGLGQDRHFDHAAELHQVGKGSFRVQREGCAVVAAGRGPDVSRRTGSLFARVTPGGDGADGSSGSPAGVCDAAGARPGLGGPLPLRRAPGVGDDDARLFLDRRGPLRSLFQGEPLLPGPRPMPGPGHPRLPRLPVNSGMAASAGCSGPGH